MLPFSAAPSSSYLCTPAFQPPAAEALIGQFAAAPQQPASSALLHGTKWGNDSGGGGGIITTGDPEEAAGLRRCSGDSSATVLAMAHGGSAAAAATCTVTSDDSRTSRGGCGGCRRVRFSTIAAPGGTVVSVKPCVDTMRLCNARATPSLAHPWPPPAMLAIAVAGFAGPCS